MSWTPPDRGGGWRKARETASHVTYTIRTVWQLVAGGVIRYGKTAWHDVTHAGFWLGVPADGIARFHVGGPARALLWDGADLVVRGALVTPTVTIDDDGLAVCAGADLPNRIRFTRADGAECASLSAPAVGGPWVVLQTPRAATPGQSNYIDLFADGDLGESVRVRLYNQRGTRNVARIEFQIGNLTVVTIDAGGLHAVNSWTGTFRTDELAAITVQDGIITSVA